MVLGNAHVVGARATRLYLGKDVVLQSARRDVQPVEVKVAQR
jgi:hypothetical protein